MSRRVKVPAGEEDRHLPAASSRCLITRSCPFIEGDGTGPDIWRASVRVLDAAVEQAYGGKRRIALGRGVRGREGAGRLRRRTARRTSCRPRPWT